MFLVAVMAFVALLCVAVPSTTGAAQVAALVGAGASGAIVAMVLFRMWNSPGAVKDWRQGGVAWVRDGPHHLRWGDWEIALSREGVLDKRSGQLQLRRRALCGLIPLETIERPVRDFYRVKLETAQHTNDDGFVSAVTYTLLLVDRKATRVNVFDLSTGSSGGEGGDALIEQLREGLEDAVAGRLA